MIAIIKRLTQKMKVKKRADFFVVLMLVYNVPYLRTTFSFCRKSWFFKRYIKEKTGTTISKNIFGILETPLIKPKPSYNYSRIINHAGR